MSVLVVVATEHEIAPFANSLEYIAQKSPKVKSYKINNLAIDILITGIGMVNTTYWLTKCLRQTTYKLVLNAGIAGSFNPILKIGSVVNVVSEIFSELGAEDGDNFFDLVELGLTKEDDFPYISNTLRNNYQFTTNTVKELMHVNGITVNKVHGNGKSIAEVKKLHNPDIESMEGAAVFFCCLMENVNFIELRAISNKVELRDRSKWDIPLAIKNLNFMLQKIVEEKNKFLI